MADCGLTVRMYNVGFGDCFLISYDPGGGTRRILVDCGAHLSGPGPHSIGEVVGRLVNDVTGEDGVARIDVVIATHRHFDHIAGFDNAAWSGVQVGEVWLPWTEHPADPVAVRLRTAQARMAAALAEWAAGRKRAASVHALALNALSNADAMSTLQTGFAGHPTRRYLPEADEPSSFSTDCLPDATIHVLGPSRDPDVIRDMDPPRDQSYLRLLGGAASGPGLIPFPGVGVADASLEHDDAIASLRKALRVNELELAASLESAVNGTSLVLAVEIGAAVLLLTGDAQWGTWRVALDSAEWRTLLARTTFLKIGHHGSHNASPKKLVDGPLPDDIPAMVSVRHIDRWPFIPKKELLERLAEKQMSIARSDQPQHAPANVHRESDWYLEVQLES